MLPPPDSTDQVPPAGLPANVLVSLSQMAVAVVVFTAAPGSEFTVKLTSAVVAGQLALAGMV